MLLVTSAGSWWRIITRKVIVCNLWRIIARKVILCNGNFILGHIKDLCLYLVSVIHSTRILYLGFSNLSS